MEKNNVLWYTRRQGVINGPFTSPIIINNITLNRLAMHDEVSHDQLSWHTIRDKPELHPASIDKNKKKKSLDERNGFDRRQDNKIDELIAQQRKKDRRRQENREEIYHRQFHTLLMRKFRERKETLFWPLFSIFSVLSLVTLLAFSFSPEIAAPLPNCATEPMPGVNWNNCLKAQLNFQDQDLSNAQLRNSQLMGSNLMNTTLIGADLAYADLGFSNLSYSQLQNTILLGASLKKADLTNADLTNADLSYADLSGATLSGSVITNTRFEHAIWPNGQLCAPGSIGECIAVTK
ncbi:MAG: pentapeptide repeat-containing protein [Methylophagaceae bacterium]